MFVSGGKMTKREKLVNELNKVEQQISVLKEKQIALKSDIEAEELNELKETMKKKGMSAVDLINLMNKNI